MTGGKLGVWLLGICCLAANGAEPEMNRIPAGDARLEYSSYVRKNVSGEGVGFDRVLPHGRNYQLDNPGVRLRFRCDAKDLQVELGYLERNNPVRARNGVGVFRIDGAGREEWRFDRPAPAGREPEIVTVKLPADGGFHDYELILPYGDRVEVRAVLTDPAARFERPAARPAKRVVFYGDSVTHGFTASRIDRTYPFLVGEKLGVEAVNLGLGGIGLNPVAAKQLAELPMDLLVVAIGVNDWQGDGRRRSTRSGRRSSRSGFTPAVRICRWSGSLRCGCRRRGSRKRRSMISRSTGRPRRGRCGSCPGSG